MGVIIGGMTTVIIDSSSGFQSINWATQVQPTRLWQLGSWNPYRTQVSKMLTVNVTTYAGSIGQVSLLPSVDCIDSTAQKDVYIGVASCGPTAAITLDWDEMFLMSYSYSKGDPIGLGMESWSFQKWVDADATGAEFLNIAAATAVIQGRTEGTRTGNVGNGTTDLGVHFFPDGQVTGSQGSVTAGFPGIGNADDITYGLIDIVGGGMLEDTGGVGQSNASVPHQPLYLG
jgi:hypothetical protein